jgi:RNase P/RNase MRP subunit p30
MREGIISRLKRAPESSVKYPYLIVSDNLDESAADILMVSDFHRAKEKLKKRIKKGTGLEVTVAPARKMDAAGVGRWFEGIRELHLLCQSSKCQFILSSGATSKYEMVSGPCLDAILKNCGINPHRHWLEMNSWLETRLSRRVSV